MLRWRWLVAGAVTSAMAGSGLLTVSRAQETATEAAVTESSPAEEAAAQTASEDLLDADALDELVAPVALYPDALLAQVLVAATYPLDVVKADRFIDENKDVPEKERADKAAQEDWDPSIATLAGGFPSVIARMADDLDWTESLGDAVLAQSDDVLDSVQRMRARAVAAGTLSSNEAQVVDTEGDNVSIEPADPNVVYVPAYDASTAYTAPPAGTVATAPVYPVDTGWNTGQIITTGAIAFGGALLLNEIFDNNDDHDYWYGPGHIDWDNDDIYPRRPNREINGDVNIDRSRNKVVVRNGEVGNRIGDNNRANIDRSDAWRPDPKRQSDARDKIASRSGNQANAASARKKLEAREGGGAGALAAGAGGAAAAGAISRSGGGNDARAKLQSAGKKRTAAGKPSIDASAFKPSDSGKVKSAVASDRGRESLGNAKLPQGAKKPAVKKAGPKSKTAVSRPSSAGKSLKSPPRKPAAKSSAFSKPSSGQRAKAASSRGHASRGGGGRGGGGRGGGGGGGGRRR